MKKFVLLLSILITIPTLTFAKEVEVLLKIKGMT